MQYIYRILPCIYEFIQHIYAIIPQKNGNIEHMYSNKPHTYGNIDFCNVCHAIKLAKRKHFCRMFFNTCTTDVVYGAA